MPLQVACDNWTDPRNVGMLFRLADGLGIEALILGGQTPSPPHKKLHRSARSTEQWIPFHLAEDLVSYLLEKKKEDFLILGLEITDSSKDLYQHPLSFDQPIILVAGNEQAGIQPEVLAVLDDCLHLPLAGRNSSLNVTMALAMASADIRRRFLEQG